MFLFRRIIRSFPRMFDFRLKLSRKRSTDSTKRGKRSLSDFSKSILYRKRWCCSTRPLVTVHFPLLVFPATSFFSHLDLLLPPSLLSSLSLSPFLAFFSLSCLHDLCTSPSIFCSVHGWKRVKLLNWSDLYRRGKLYDSILNFPPVFTYVFFFFLWNSII